MLYGVLYGYMLYSVIIFVRNLIYWYMYYIDLTEVYGYLYVCMFVCLSPSLSSNTYSSWPLFAYGMRWTPSVQKP